MVAKAPYLAKLPFEPVAVPLVERPRHQWKRRVLGAANADRANERSPAFDADGAHGGPYRPERRLYFSRQPPQIAAIRKTVLIRNRLPSSVVAGPPRRGVTR